MEAEEKLRRSFDNIYDQHPFLAAIVASWKVHESKRIKTAATNGPQMFWNRDFLNKCSIGETTALIYHEAFHIFLLHHLRFEGIDATEWNIAADLAGNYYCREYIPRKIGDINLCFPGQGSFSHLEVNQDAEWYYKKLHEENQKQPKPQPGQGEPEKGEGEGSGGSQDKSDESQDTKDESEGSDESDEESDKTSEGNKNDGKESEPGAGEGGSGKGQLPSEPNLPEGYESSDMPGEILPYPGEITEEVVREWEQKTAEAINIAMSHGNAPGFIKELAEQLIGSHSKVNWKAELRRFLTKYAPTRYSFAKPNRRFSWRKDVIMPARKSRTAAPGVFYVDTSGSMDVDQFNRGMAEVRGILEAYEHCEVTLVQGDTEIYPEKTKIFDRWNLNDLKIPMEWVGRGGTELSGGMMELAKSGKYSWIVVVSDMYWQVNRVEDVGVPVFWLMTEGKPPYDYMIPKFGVAIELPKEAA